MLFFLKILKTTTNIFLNFFFFYLNVQSFRLIMENNFIQMAASTVFHQCLHEYWSLKRQLLLRNTYL